MSTSAGPGYPGGSQEKTGARSAEYDRQGTDYADESRGTGSRSQQTGGTVARHVKTPETKEFFKTSEFAVWALTVLGILIAAAVVSEGSGSDFPASRAWLYVAVVSAAYIVSRGIAKAATQRGYGDAPLDRGAPFQRGDY